MIKIISKILIFRDKKSEHFIFVCESHLPTFSNIRKQKMNSFKKWTI